jgi:hypothetical protein
MSVDEEADAVSLVKDAYKHLKPDTFEKKERLYHLITYWLGIENLNYETLLDLFSYKEKNYMITNSICEKLSPETISRLFDDGIRGSDFLEYYVKLFGYKNVEQILRELLALKGKLDEYAGLFGMKPVQETLVG